MKPPYKIPSVAEIRASEPNGYRVASLFSGAGGSSTGYRMAGYKVIYANEFVQNARTTYRLNWPDTYLDPRDIRKITGGDIMAAAGLVKGELDLLDGSPPCVSFSQSGSRHESWGVTRKYSDTKQRTDDLFSEYARILAELQPRVFVAENVSGLVHGYALGYFKQIHACLSSCGYRVAARTVDAQHLGVPQIRSRLIFIGVRNELELEPVHPKPLPYSYTISDACPNIIKYVMRDRVVKDKWNMRYHAKVSPVTTIAAAGLGSWVYIVTRADPSDYYRDGTGWRYVKPNGEVVEHEEFFTIREVKALCSFPSDYQLTGNYKQQWERLGRAVPPRMMYWIAKTIQTEILDKVSKSELASATA